MNKKLEAELEKADDAYRQFNSRYLYRKVKQWILDYEVDTDGCESLADLVERLFAACPGIYVSTMYQLIPDAYIGGRALETAVSKDIHGQVISGIDRNERTPRICELAVSSKGLALRSVPAKLRTLELCELAVSNDGRALKCVPAKMKRDPEAMRRLHAASHINNYEVLRAMPPEHCFEFHSNSDKLARAFDITTKGGKVTRVRGASKLLSVCAAMPLASVTARTRTAVRLLSEMEPAHAAMCAVSGTWMVQHLCEESKAALTASNPELLETFDFF